MRDPLVLRDVIARRAALRMGILTLILTGALCVLALTRYNALDFARMGERFCCGVPEGSKGYDGQFVLYIAAFGANATPLIDGATLRYQRILYPVTARALAFGVSWLTPYTLIMINVAAHAVGAGLLTYLMMWISARHGQRVRKSLPITALVFSLWFGALMAVRLDLNEPLCIALALAAVIAYTHQKNRLTAALLILSTLTKEIGLVFAAALALHALSNREGRRALYLIAAPVFAFLAWWGVLYVTFGALPTQYPAARNLLPIPFNGLFAETDLGELIMLVIWLAIPTLILFIVAAWKVVHERRISLGAALMLAAAAWVMLMPDVSWVDPVAAYRVATPLIVCGLLFVAESYPRRIWWLFGLWLGSIVLMLIVPGMW